MKFTKKRMFFFGLIFLNVILSAWFVIRQDILFHTDIARDFLLLEDIVKNKPITLIGPRSGGIPGVFHGPLWLYLNLPAFLIGRGNPIIVGWFWVLLFILTIFLVYKTAKRFFNEEIALPSALLFSAVSASAIRALFNPFGAVIVFPLFFLCFYEYLNKKEIKFLLISYFLVGLIIQFQIAFGLPILVLTTIYLIFHLYKTKKYRHFFAVIILVIPLSTYFLFEIRHQFLQLKSILHFLRPEISNQSFRLLPFLAMRAKGFFIDGVDIFPVGFYWFKLIVVTLPFIFLAYKTVIKKDRKKALYFLFFYYYVGFWFFTFFFKGVIWSYYYWPFLPMIAIVFSSIIRFINKKVFYAAFFLIITLIITSNAKDMIGSGKYIGHDASSWKFNFLIASRVFNENKDEFGYYIFTPDQYGYSPKYALNYVQSKYPDIKAFPFTKKPITYLFIAAAPKDRLFLNGEWWQQNQVKIDKKPANVYRYANGFKIEKYLLDDEEIKIKSDPNLIQTLIFR